MSRKTWTAVDEYVSTSLIGDDTALEAALENNRKNDLPAIDVSPAQGKLLYLFARMIGARRILEIGTLGGYSTIWLARALPADGKAVTLEVERRHAEVARANIDRAGLSGLVDLHVGPARDTLAKLEKAGGEPFDLVFIDADKPNNRHYLAAALKLSRPGTVIICDNVIRDGDVIDSSGRDPNVVGAREAFELIGKEQRLEGTAIQTVGVKGYDGFAIAVVR